ncbi:CHY zinc finger protein [Halobacillus campisalis]|uniref:CHY zinc finger protein n=1 Tax=Halobacillus campisalis TaxID=435909 RepID=A0ABW2JYY5_9BACI|nr:CHY zinc finger protein [Halobacillus campisalis]
MSEHQVKGREVDANTRCAHYHSEVDIIAIKFYCCSEYYACYYCHKECAGHPAEKWPKTKQDETAILCGSCKYELSINEYIHTSSCPKCHHPFNEGCSSHFHLYFDMT